MLIAKDAAYSQPSSRLSRVSFIFLLFVCISPSRVYLSSATSRVINKYHGTGNNNHRDSRANGRHINATTSFSSSSSFSDSFGWRSLDQIVDFSVDSEETTIRHVKIDDVLREKLLLIFPRIFRSRDGGSGARGDGVGREDRVGGKSHFRLELIRLTYLPIVAYGGVRRRVPLSAQHLNVGTRIDFNVTSQVDRKSTCLGADGCVYDRHVSFAFDDTRSPIRWPSQLRAAFNPLSVFPSDSRPVNIQLCANREAWRIWHGYVPCVSAQLEPWFWMSLTNKTEWNEALHCRRHDDDADADHFCCVCAPDADDGTSICDASYDVSAQIRHFATSAKCVHDRRLGPRGTYGACPYQCACGRADVMTSRCGLLLKEEMTEKWSAELLTELAELELLAESRREDYQEYQDYQDYSASGVAPGEFGGGGFKHRLLRFFVSIFAIVRIVV